MVQFFNVQSTFNQPSKFYGIWRAINIYFYRKFLCQHHINLLNKKFNHPENQYFNKQRKHYFQKNYRNGKIFYELCHRTTYVTTPTIALEVDSSNGKERET